MNEFKVITIMNEAMLKLLKDKNSNYDENMKIRKFLEDETVFFKISKQEAYTILKNVGVKQENLEDVYKKLTSQKMFYDLVNRGKINKDDKSIIIKYTLYDKDDIFKKKNK